MGSSSAVGARRLGVRRGADLAADAAGAGAGGADAVAGADADDAAAMSGDERGAAEAPLVDLSADGPGVALGGTGDPAAVADGLVVERAGAWRNA